MFKRTVLDNPFIPQTERPSEKQAKFLSYFSEEALYGGAAGSGKTSALLMAALQFVEVPGYAALLIRRKFTDLKQGGGLIERSMQWLGGKASWNGSDYRWTFPSGATLSFGYYDSENHFTRYQGGAWHFVGWDELTQFPLHWYQYLFSRQRKLEGFDVPIRTRSATNPGGPGHLWVKKRFVDPKTASHYFVPAKVAENPGLNVKDYVRRLKKSGDVVTVAQLLHGDWSAQFGGRFFREWFPEYRVYTDEDRNKRIVIDGGDERGILARACTTFVTCDPACTPEQTTRKGQDADYTVIGVFAMTPCRKVLILKMVRKRLAIDRIVPTLAKICVSYKPDWVGIEDTGFQVGILKEAQRHPQLGTVIGLSPEGRGKLVRATPAINRASEGLIFLPEDGADVPDTSSKYYDEAVDHPWKEDFLEELEQFTGDEKQDSHDDFVDVLSYGIIRMDRLGMTPDVVESDESAFSRNGFYGY